MKIGPKYKIARRLGAPIFEKTQSQKFALSESRKEHSSKRRRPKARTEFAIQMTEKQKARYIYGLSEKQFSNYVKKALSQGGAAPAATLFALLETRLDNVIYRLGLTTTRRAARQMVSHGHIAVNGHRSTIPSQTVKKGDTVAIRASSQTKTLFADLKERLATVTIPGWLTDDQNSHKATIQGAPVLEGQDLLFDINAVLDFYSR